MTNNYYNVTGNPVDLSLGNSSVVRNEYILVQAGFALLPTVIQNFSDSANYAIDSGVAANTYVIAVNAAIVSPNTDGLAFVFKTANANTGASTLNGIAIERVDGTALQAGDIIAGFNAVRYNDTTASFNLTSLSATVAASNAAASAAAALASQNAAAASAATAASYAAALTSTSTTSLTIGTGTKVFTTQASKGYAAGQFFSAISAANSANFMHGTVTSYVGTTLTTNVTDIGGSGTLADWNLSISGSQGSTGATGAPGAWVYLSTVTPSASATADIETTFNSTYSTYAIVGSLILPATDAQDLLMRHKLGGTYQTGGNHEYHVNISAGSFSAYAGSAATAGTSILVASSASNGASAGVDFVMIINSPSDTTSLKQVQWTGSERASGGGAGKNATGYGVYTASTAALTGVRFFFASGNIASGNFYLYGLAKA